MSTSFTSFSTSKFAAKYFFNSSNPTPSCTNDYAVYATASINGSPFNLVAFTNLYLNASGGSSFCPGTTPKLLFSYDTSTASPPGEVNGSPALSLDGTQIAFIETSTEADFHVLKWAAATSTPTFPGNTGTVGNCAVNGTLPCQYTLVYTGNHSANISSPFVDYSTDTAYVTDDVGNVYAISPVFGGGAPAIRTGWPSAGINVGVSTPLTAPAYDSVSAKVFVAGGNGKLYFIKTTGTCGATAAPCLGGSVVASASAITTPPIIDSTTQKVLVFSSSAPVGSGVFGASVVQIDTSLGARVVAGIGGGFINTIGLGDFNDTYYSLGASASGAALYVCGDNILADAGVLYAFPFNATPTVGTLNPIPVVGSPLPLTSSLILQGGCSPITESFNQSTSNDRIFLGVTANCNTGDAAGCIQSYDITNGFPAAAAAHAAEPGGTSGIVIDNVADQSAGAQITTDIYFLNAGSQSCNKYSGGTTGGNCAVSMTQSGLH
jgi:hypothetical protein